jgi:hypothetical protein
MQPAQAQVTLDRELDTELIQGSLSDAARSRASQADQYAPLVVTPPEEALP